MIKLRNRYTGEAGPEVQIADSRYSKSMASTAAHLWKGRGTISSLLCHKITREPCALQWYLQLPSPRSGKFQVDNSSRIGNVQQLCEALRFTDDTTLKK